MNKKEFLGYFSILLIFLVSFVYALDVEAVDSSLADLENKVDNVGQIIDSPIQTKEEISRDYLRKKWFSASGLLAKNPIFGGAYNFYLTNQNYIDPVFVFIFGLEPIFSWLFFLNFIIVFCLMTYFFRFYEILRDFSTFSNSTAKVISVCFFAILMIIGFFRTLATLFSTLIINLISSLDSIPMQIIGVLASIFFFIFIIKFSKQIKLIIHIRSKENKELHREMRGELAVAKLETYGKALDEGFKDN